MKEQHNIDESIWNYIDGSLSAGDRSFVEKLVETDAEWKMKYIELSDVHKLMQGHLELEQPSMRFTQNVMEEISRLYITPAARTYINKNVIRGIAIFFISTIVGLLGYAFGTIDWTQRPADPTKTLPQVDWQGLFSSTQMNIFIMVNIILGLMLLDMYLTNRKKKMAAGQLPGA